MVIKHTHSERALNKIIQIISTKAFKAIVPAAIIGALIGAQQYSDAAAIFSATLFYFIQSTNQSGKK